jgi:hypothetical protein
MFSAVPIPYMANLKLIYYTKSCGDIRLRVILFTRSIYVNVGYKVSLRDVIENKPCVVLTVNSCGSHDETLN